MSDIAVNVGGDPPEKIVDTRSRLAPFVNAALEHRGEWVSTEAPNSNQAASIAYIVCKHLGVEIVFRSGKLWLRIPE